MSTRQRFTHETTADPVMEAPRLLPRAVESGAPPVEDIAARRLRELAERVSHAAVPASGAEDDRSLDEADAEFEPVSLATILALGRDEQPDTTGEAAAEAHEPVETVVPIAVVATSPFLPVANDDEAAPLTSLAMLSDDAIDEPEHLEVEVLEASVDIQQAPSSEDSAPEESADAVEDTDAPLAADQPLMLADQSASTPDIRLVDLIRRQQSLLDQLNSFPPSYEALDKSREPATVETAEPEAAEPAPRSLVEQLAPPPPQPTPPPAPAKAAQESPPSLPPFEIAALPPPRPSMSSVRPHRDEPSEADLPQQSPIIIQRARAERSGRRIGPAVAAPPSAIPAFLGGLALALVVAGVLFAVL